MRMNSDWAISQSLGKTSDRNRVYEEKTSDTEDDGVTAEIGERSRPEKVVAGKKRASECRKRDDKFQKSKQGGGRVRKHTWFFLWIPDPEQGCPVLAWNMLPVYPWCVSLNFPKLDLKKHPACFSCRFVSSNGTEIVPEV